MNGGINAALAQGIAQHKSAVSLAKDLMRYLDGDQCKYYAKRVAQTSINHAYHLAGMEAAKQNPFCEAIHWQLSASHKIYDICDEYARNDEGLGLGNFDKRLLPLPHANCMCSQYQVLTQSLDKCANELRAWLDGEQNAKLDNAFGAWKSINELDKDKIPARIKLKGSQTLRSLGAKARNYDIEDADGQVYHYLEGTYVQNREVFAGFGVKAQLHEGVAEGLTQAYGGDAIKWQHVKGIGTIDLGGEVARAEVHWFQEPSVGEVKHRIKEWLE